MLVAGVVLTTSATAAGLGTQTQAIERRESKKHSGTSQTTGERKWERTRKKGERAVTKVKEYR